MNGAPRRGAVGIGENLNLGRSVGVRAVGQNLPDILRPISIPKTGAVPIAGQVKIHPPAERIVRQIVRVARQEIVAVRFQFPADIRRELESDCDDFLTRNAHYLTDDPFRGGMDFHLTRNRHGAGFWDGDWPKDIGQILTDRAHTYGTAEIQVFTDSNGAAAWCAIH